MLGSWIGMRRGAVLRGIVAGLALAMLVGAGTAARAEDPGFRVLVFSKTAGFRHDSIPAGVEAIKKLGEQNGFAVDTTEDAAEFTDATLARYDAVVFLSTTSDFLDESQQQAFERYIRSGGGYVGIHAAADGEYEWEFYGRMVGAYFRGHPEPQDATVVVEDRNHISTAHLPERWDRFDEWYNYKAPEEGPNGVFFGGFQLSTTAADYSPRPEVHVLARLDESTYNERDDSGDDDHPIAWYREFEGGRSFYTGGGHTKESFAEEAFLQHLLGGIRWAAGWTDRRAAAPAQGGATGDTAPPSQGQTPAAPGLALAIALDRRSIERALRLGIRARVRCTIDCVPRLALRTSAAAARRHGLGSRTVARGGGSKFSGRRTFQLQFTAGARRKLREVGRMRLTLVGTATDAEGRRVDARRTVTLR